MLLSNLSFESLLNVGPILRQAELTSQQSQRTLSASHEWVRQKAVMAANVYKGLIIITEGHDLKNKPLNKLDVLPIDN